MFNTGTSLKNILLGLLIPLFTGCMKASLSPLVSENEIFRKITIQSGTTVLLEEGIGHQISLAIETPSVNGITLHGTTYTYQVVSIDTAGNTSTSACSSALTIDTTSPTITNVTSNKANGSYTVGEIVDVRITFSENVFVTGTPLLALNTTPQRSASYVSGSATNVLVFNYTVQATDTASDLNYLATTSLTVASASIRDAASNSAVLTLPAIGAAGYLGANKNITIDTTAPTITAFTVTNATPTNSTTFNISSS